MGISIVWFEVNAEALEAWRKLAPAAVPALEAAWHDYLDNPPADVGQGWVTSRLGPPVLRLWDHDWKARVCQADDFSSDAGDRVHAALAGDQELATVSWSDGSLRAYSQDYLRAVIASLPDDPAHPGHDLRQALADVLARGTGLLSLRT